MGKHLFFVIIAAALWTRSSSWAKGDLSKESASESSMTNNCQSVEAVFQSYLVGLLDKIEMGFKRDSSCFAKSLMPEPAQKFCEKRKSKIQEDLKKHNDFMRKHRTYLTRQWAKKLPYPQLIKFCFADSIDQIQMDKHSRMIKLKENLKRTERLNCYPQQHRFSADVLQKENIFISDSNYQGLNFLEKIFLGRYRKTPYYRTFGDSFLNSSQYSKKEIYERAEQVAVQLKKQSSFLKNHIVKLQSDDLYKIYVFENEFETFKKTLNPNLSKKAEHCFETSYFGRECLNVSVGACLSRSMNRPIKAITDYTPILSALKLIATDDIQVNQSAFEIGLKTLEEYNRTQFNFMSKAASSFPNVSAWALRGAGVLSRPVARVTFDTLHQRMQTVVTQYNLRNADYFFDTNISLALVRNIDAKPKNISDTQVFIRLAEHFDETPKGFVQRDDIFNRVALTPTLRSELKGASALGSAKEKVPSAVTRANPDMVRAFEDAGIGKVIGDADRAILGEIIAASRVKKRVMNFVTADRRLLNALCRLAQICGLGHSVFDMAPEGFDFAIGGGAIRVVPISTRP